MKDNDTNQIKKPSTQGLTQVNGISTVVFSGS
jgi:hypothetical protein